MKKRIIFLYALCALVGSATLPLLALKIRLKDPLGHPIHIYPLIDETLEERGGPGFEMAALAEIDTAAIFKGNEIFGLTLQYPRKVYYLDFRSLTPEQRKKLVVEIDNSQPVDNPLIMLGLSDDPTFKKILKLKNGILTYQEWKAINMGAGPVAEAKREAGKEDCEKELVALKNKIQHLEKECDELKKENGELRKQLNI